MLYVYMEKKRVNSNLSPTLHIKKIYLQGIRSRHAISRRKHKNDSPFFRKVLKCPAELLFENTHLWMTYDTVRKMVSASPWNSLKIEISNTFPNISSSSSLSTKITNATTRCAHAQ